ncbi:protein of unknown function [Legionella fallonii LLAP-10]|uniref:Uncharacterized protein n=1 Tax=Legionella fallonii LLAP-10 TaxID=1212491 RepID=A0A098G4A1_9GAMM|nr:protein of unknown function [Legionella fallonii LLAP-10]
MHDLVEVTFLSLLILPDYCGDTKNPINKNELNIQKNSVKITRCFYNNYRSFNHHENKNRI